MRGFASDISTALFVLIFSIGISFSAHSAELSAAQRTEAAAMIKDIPEKDFWTMFSMLASPGQNMAAARHSISHEFFSKMLKYGAVEEVILEDHLRQAYGDLFLFFKIPPESRDTIILIFKEAQPQNISKIDNIVKYQLKLEGTQ